MQLIQTILLAMLIRSWVRKRKEIPFLGRPVPLEWSNGVQIRIRPYLVKAALRVGITIPIIIFGASVSRMSAEQDVELVAIFLSCLLLVQSQYHREPTAQPMPLHSLIPMKSQQLVTTAFYWINPASKPN